jgi:aldose 1-epimerase
VAAFRARAQRANPVASVVTAFQARTLVDEATGWSIVELAGGDPRRPEARLAARIAPAAGSNLYSLAVGGDELLYQPATMPDLAGQHAGTPVLFPTPNRVRDSVMQFEGRRFTFEPNSGPNFIHGLARRCPWQIGSISAGRAAARAETFLVWDAQQPEFARFPLPHRLALSYTLARGGLRIGFRVDNHARERLPFGFGLHPYFQIPGGDRARVLLQVPLARRMEAEAYLPSGRLLPVAGTAHDLRKLGAIAGRALDDVYFGMRPGKRARFQLRGPGIEVSFAGSAAFTHLVVYTPPDRPFFCVENQTSSTDAHNLWAAGARRTAHLMVVAPGKHASGHVLWRVKRLPRGGRGLS